MQKIICKAAAVCLIGIVSYKVQSQIAINNEAKINALISKMTLKEKVGMIHGNSSFTSAGVPRLGIP